MQSILTTAVIDARHGAPAKGMLVDLFRLPGSGGDRRHLRTIETNEQGGVDAPLLAGDEFAPATYELLYHIGRYFKAAGAAREDAPFLDVVPVRFALSDPARACHVALVVSPLSYTMYRA
jgi:5-hydroxyisourate hydrolase